MWIWISKNKIIFHISRSYISIFRLNRYTKIGIFIFQSITYLLKTGVSCKPHTADDTGRQWRLARLRITAPPGALAFTNGDLICRIHIDNSVEYVCSSYNYTQLPHIQLGRLRSRVIKHKVFTDPISGKEIT